MRLDQLSRLLLLVLALIGSGCRDKATTISAEDAARIGTRAYIYGYPLVTMEMMRRQMTNVAAPSEAKAPMGQFSHIRQYPKASFKHHKAPDTDILASSSWVDVGAEPYILHVPKVSSRYYLVTLVSGWSELFSTITPRVNGGEACDYAITGPMWEGSLPSTVQEIKSPTNLVWINARTACSGSAEDYKTVHTIQNLYSLKTLSAFKQNTIPTPHLETIDPSIDMHTSVHDQVHAMDIETFFNLMTALMKNNPGGPEDQGILSDMALLGLVPGGLFSLTHFDKAVSQALQDIPQAAQTTIANRTVDTSNRVNGWIILPHSTDKEDYLQRASQALLGIRVALPEDALFAFTAHDLDEKQLIGTNEYIIHFTKDQIPPVHSFWSLAAYNDKYHLTPNALNRYNIHSEDHLKFNLDGSLDIYVQHASPGPNKAANWLPIPKGAFVLMFRLYRPKEEILKGTWTPPSVIIDPF